MNQSLQVVDSIPILDTARFEQMQRIATAMADCEWIPEHFRGYREKEGDKDVFYEYPQRKIIANCFLVVNQAVRWGFDPFALAACVSIVRGKICYEGKVIAAVLDAKLGLNLVPEWDDKTGDQFGIVIYAYDQEGRPVVNPRTQKELTISGTVGEWKTTNSGSPWQSPKNHRRQLMYRGSREWVRIFKPALLLGVYADDEMDELSSASHSSKPRGADMIEARGIPAPPKKEEEVETLAIENKQQIPMETIEATSKSVVVEEKAVPAPVQRRIPAPPQKQNPAGVFTPFGAAKFEFERGIKSLNTREELGDLWNIIVEPIYDSLSPEQQDELVTMNRAREMQFPLDDEEVAEQWGDE